MITLSPKYIKRFWSKVDKRGREDCWNWKAAKGSSGYGYFYVGNRKIINAHRISYSLFYGDIPDKLYVLHKCDNTSCVNPHHLYLGTHADNMSDATAKGLLGNSKGKAKLYDEEIWLMKKLYNSGKVTCINLSKMFKISDATVSRQLRGVHGTKEAKL